ncbi:hypothetical protein HAX54_034279 [Datura stramonium]|uniref:Uncharacterized protein n=1 Tax=Datura stramonium TaxID=4076 RepID=A0ABS8VDW4_DATST|nr:hypothetical protein [Datura stramonium]
MRCDLSTSSSAHISLLVSGSAQTCFDDLLLENHIKSEIIENSTLVHVLPSDEEIRPPISEPRRSMSVACGSEVFEVCMKVPMWASQVFFERLETLGLDVSYRSLVALGIASIQGLAVASFEKDDAERLLSSWHKATEEWFFGHPKTGNPSMVMTACSSRKEVLFISGNELYSPKWVNTWKSYGCEKEEKESLTGMVLQHLVTTEGQKLKVAAMRPILMFATRKCFLFRNFRFGEL